MPPVTAFIFVSISFEAVSVACLIAVVITSSNISIVSSSTESGFSGLIVCLEIFIDLNLP